MQGKGFVIAFAILLGILSVNQLSYTWYANKVRKEASEIAKNNPQREKEVLDSLAKADTLNLGITSYNYQEAVNKEMNLGLDLKGGMNVLLQINEKDLLLNYADYSTNQFFQDVLKSADLKQKNGNSDYIDDFFKAYYEKEEELGTKIPLSSSDIFGNKNLSNEINFNTPNEEVEKLIRTKIEASVATAYEVIRARIDQFGVTQPNVQRVENSGRILVELPGIKDTERVKKLLQSSAKLEFWEVATAQETQRYFSLLDAKAAVILKQNTTQIMPNEFASKLYAKQPNGAQVGVVKVSDTAYVNKIINSNEALALKQSNLKYIEFYWSAKENEDKTLDLYAIKNNPKRKAPLDGDNVTGANTSFDELNRPVINMQMSPEGSSIWKNVTEKNIGRPIAVVLDKLVYTAPTVNSVIPTGQSQISGNYSVDEAKDLVNVLGAGKLPASAKIIQAEVVGPSLGKESIQQGIISFVVALALVLVYMIFYYASAGVYANIALIINLLFIFGILASFKAVLTLPGIAGIVLTIGMSVDANVIIFERIKEEIRLGKKLALATADGFKHALSSILDGNITIFLTALVLFFFGEGPVKGFATTLMVGIVTSVFSAVLLSRYLMERTIEKGGNISFSTAITKNWLQNLNVDFIGKRKIAYVISAVLVLISIVSLATNKLNLGTDFKGGRSYVVRLEKPVDTEKLANELGLLFADKDGNKEVIQVKTFGNENQVKISTKYKIEDESTQVESEIETKIFDALKSYLPAGITKAKFSSPEAKSKIGIMSSIKVGPAVADDITIGAFIAVGLSLLIVFVYLVFRFRKWQYSLGAVLAVIHDVLIVLGVFSLFYTILPFSLEIDQAFIAAILTVIGYSINDTVIIFDRIRENTNNILTVDKKRSFSDLINYSINSTLGRTLNTSLITLFIIIIIFLFGGENIRGFMFALLVGIGVGTYSSIFIASFIMYELVKKTENK